MTVQVRRVVPTSIAVVVVLTLAVPALADFSQGADTDCDTSIPPKASATADFTGNGTPGVASAPGSAISGADVSVWTNDGSWDATQCPDTGEDTYSLGSNVSPKGGIAAGVFNEPSTDPDPDIVATGINMDTDEHVIWVFENDGSGSFASVDEYTLTNGEVPTEAVTAKVDDDDYEDVITANKQSDSVSVFLNKGDNGSKGDRFHGPDHYSLKGGARNPVQLVAADMDGDGDPDVVTANSQSDNISVLTNDGDGTLSDQGATSVGNTPLGVTTGDFDDDGFPDVAVANSDDNEVEVLGNKTLLNGSWNGLEKDVAFLDTNSGPESVTAADLLNSDGAIDLAAVSGQNIAVFENTDGSVADAWSLGTEYDVGTWKPRQVVADDLDGDGQPDLVTPVDAGQVSVLFN